MLLEVDALVLLDSQRQSQLEDKELPVKGELLLSDEELIIGEELLYEEDELNGDLSRLLDEKWIITSEEWELYEPYCSVDATLLEDDEVGSHKQSSYIESEEVTAIKDYIQSSFSLSFN